MPVTINSVGAVQRIRVTGDPSAAGSVPALASEGDLVYDESTGDTYEVGGAGKSIEVFVDDLSRWYIRRSRRRFSVVFKKGATTKDEKDYLAASRTLGFALSELGKMTAPFTPLFSEMIHDELGKNI